MADRSGEAQSQLYLLRVWATVGADGTPTCRGKLQPVLGGRGYCFVDASELYALLHTLLADTAGPGPGDVPPAQAPGAEK